MESDSGLYVALSGRVQGVGFRPFVLRLAQRLGLEGDVANVGAWVEIHAYGPAAALEALAHAVLSEAPALARPVLEQRHALAPRARSGTGFHILPSRAGLAAQTRLPPDLSLCGDCQQEWNDRADRRWHHAFINCTQCGPRYTVISGLPYDRAATSMAGFAMCPACQAEYEDPASRRFHAEPVSCPACGPALQFEPVGAPSLPAQQAGDAAALAACVQTLRAGGIVAVKGIGGYHLMCDARNADSIARLRTRKHRPHKPLAVMFPWRGQDGLEMLRQYLAPGPCEAQALLDPVRPIVLVRQRAGAGLPDALAPGLDEMGAFLPYSPLHLLLLDALDMPLVATSGNRSGEPVVTDAPEARASLSAIADAFLHHDRPILRPADDSVQRVIAGAARPLRIGRGMAPLEGRLPQPVPFPLLATGGESKVTIALAFENRVVMSPHIGDLSSPRGRQVFAEVAADLQQLHGVRAHMLVTDQHPDYATTRWAQEQGLPILPVWHHHAHASALAAEHPDAARWLMLTWDGVGLGEDGTLWGGETLWGAAGQWQRVASWRPFRPPGGDRAAREPWRCAAALCWETGRDYAHAGLAPATVHMAHAAWHKGLHAPFTSATGRLFDAAAACITGLTHYSHEAQGPMQIEALARQADHLPAPVPLPLQTDPQGVLRLDWSPLLPMLLDTGRPATERAACFHHSLAAGAAAQIRTLCAMHPVDAVGLGGGVFQNRLLTELLQQALAPTGLRLVLPAGIPANDGGLAWGQIMEAAARLRKPSGGA